MNTDRSWSYICQSFSKEKGRNLSEKHFQTLIEIIFRYYLRWGEDIRSEESLRVGSVNSIRPDFVLYQDGIRQVIIEVKRAGNSQKRTNEEQLFSYMRLAQTSFGLYIGEQIRLYYDVPNDGQDPKPIFSLDYREDSKYGDDFVKLFARDTFSKEALTQYCTQRLQDIQKEEKIAEEIQLLLSDEGKNLCLQLLRGHLLSKGYTDVDFVLKNVEVQVRRKGGNNCRSLPSDVEEVEDLDDWGASGRQKYSFNGSGNHTKNRIALELVKSYLHDHPSPYRVIRDKFPNYVLTKGEVEEKRTTSIDRNIDRRWHLDLPLESSDGIVFFVTTQVGDGDHCRINFRDIVSLARELGYEVKPVAK